MNPRSINHVEIPAADRAVSAKFYAELFGWPYQHVEEPVAYTMAGAGNSRVGLTEPRVDFQVGNIFLYFTSDDIDADLKRAEELGGRIISPKGEVPGFGWFGFFADPTGNPIGLWTAAPGAGM